MWIDTHCHLNYKPIKDEIDDVVNNAKNNCIEKMLTIGTKLQESQQLEDISEKFDCVSFTIGHHPCQSDLSGSDVYQMLKNQLKNKHKKLVGIGETGLDCGNENLTQQKEVFHAHLEIAKKFDLPVVVHSRNMDQELLASLKEFKGVTGVLHCWTGEYETAIKAIDLGWIISFSGIVTFRKKVEFLWEQAKKLPLDKIVIETDAPFLAPHPNRGKTNYPENVRFVGEWIAQLRQMNVQDLQKILYKNSCSLFKNMI